MEAYAVGLSVGLRRGVPLIELQPALGLSFAPAGHTDDPEIPRVRSVVDYLARRLAVDWLPYADTRSSSLWTTASPRMFADVQRSRRWPAAGGMAGDTNAR